MFLVVLSVHADVELTQDENGNYLIGTPEELMAFSNLVNTGERGAKALLTQDIDMTGVEDFEPIGTYINNSDLAAIGIDYPEITNFSYQGTFDGQGYVIKNLNIKMESYAEAGLFSRIWSGTVKNLGIENICVQEPWQIRTGALAGFIYKSTIENCWVCGNISYETGYATPNGFSTSANGSKVINCWSTFEGPFTPENKGTQTNVHCYEKNPNIAADAPTGALCYALNEGAGEIVFYQTLGEDSYPTTNSTHKIVYIYGTRNCDGTSAEGSGYSNKDLGFVQIPHQIDEDGFCSVCGAFPQDEDGWYNICSPKGLVKFSELVNAGDAIIKGRLTKDIDMSGVENFTPIGLYRDAAGGFQGVNNNFRGEFDGGKHVISNLTVSTEEYYEAGLFSRIYSGKVWNLGIENVTITSNNDSGRLGGIAGFNREGTFTNCWTAGTITLNSPNETPGTRQIGGIAGNTNNSKGRFENCWSTYEGPLSNGSGSKSNCHSYETNPNIQEDARSGALCYLLNAESYVNPEWRQDLGSDNHPTWDNAKGIVYRYNEQYVSFNPEDQKSFNAFLSAIVDMEKDIVPEGSIATQSLLDEYANKLNSLKDIETYEAFCTEYLELLELKKMIFASIEAYDTYIAACEYALNYLNENESTSEERALLMKYLTENEGPSDEFGNGTYNYIIENHELTAQEINEETAYVNIMLQKAISGGLVPGTEITVTLSNNNFKDGLKNWMVETTNEGVTTGGETSVMTVASGLNTTFSISQTMTKVPNGIYAFSVNGFMRAGENISSTLYTSQLFLNGNMNYIMALCEDVIPENEAIDGVNCHLTGEGPDIEYYVENLGYIPNSLVGSSYAFNGGRYLNYTAVEVTDATLQLGVRNPGSGLAKDWTSFGNVRIFYLGNAEEAGEELGKVLKSYVARGKTISEFPWSDGEDYILYPNMSENLKSQLEALLGEAETATTGEQKMSLINRFSELFNEIYECRMAYVAMGSAAEALMDKATKFMDVISEEEYNAMWDVVANAWELYNKGELSTEEALAMVETLKEYTLNLGLKQDEDGVYQLEKANDLVIFSKMVNGGDNKANAVLTQDIDMTGVYNFEPIGTYINNSDLEKIGISYPEITNFSYQGTFDGQGFVIKNLSIEMETYAEAGLFSRIWSGTVKNLGIENISVQEPWQIRTGALAGFIYKSTIENCWVCGNISYETDYATPNGFAPSANGSQVINCWSTFEGPFTPENNGTQTNVHCYEKNPNIAADASTGALCYALNTGAGKTIYYQTLGEDVHPVFDATHGEVFLATDQNCDGSLKGEPAYSNTKAGTRDDHVIVNGICSVCGRLPQAEDNFFEISTPAALEWFSDWVNTSDIYAKGRLTQDIDMSGVENFTPIGLYRDATGGFQSVNNNFRGEFDGARHVISNLTVSTEEYYEAGLFSRIFGGTVKDLGIENVSVSSNNTSGRIGGIAGFNREGTFTNCWTAGTITLTCTAENPGTQIGGIAGNTNNNKGRFVNCWSTYEGQLAPGNGTKTNSYEATAEDAASGALCYALNEGAGETIYYQTLGIDAHPVFDASHEEVIKNEDGTFDNPTGIEEILEPQTSRVQDAIFDLQGRKLNTLPQRGIYIRNGKKYFVK